MLEISSTISSEIAQLPRPRGSKLCISHLSTNDIDGI